MSLVYVIIFQSINWENRFYSWINNKLTHTGWELKVGEFSGSMIGTSFLDNVILSHSNGSLVKIEKLTFNISLISSIFNNPILDFDLITMEGLVADYVPNTLSNNTNFHKNSTNIPFNVNTFFIDGAFRSNIDGKYMIFNIMMGGELKTEKYSTINFNLFKLVTNENPNFNLHFDNLVVADNGGFYFLENINGTILNFPIKGDIYFEKVLKKIKGNVELMNFALPEEMFARLPLKTKFSNFNGKFQFSADMDSFKGIINLNNKLGLDMNGEFSLFRNSKTWVLKNLQLSGEESKLQMTGSLIDRESFSCFMDLENLDLSRWIKKQKPTKLSGLFNMDATLEEGLVLDQINMNLEMVEEKLFDQGEISVHGFFNYNDSIISTFSPVIFLIDDSYLTINGKGDFKQNSVDVLLDLEKANIELINNFLPGNFLSGSATGRLNISGNFNKPSVVAELSCEDIIINEFYLKSLDLNSQIFIQDSLLNGFTDIKSGKGEWKGKHFDSGTVYGVFKNNSIIIENFHFQSDKDFLQLSGNFDGRNDYRIERIQLAHKNNYLVNAKPIFFEKKNSDINVKPFELHINDGLMEGVITKKNHSFDGKFKMSNFDAEVLTQFIDDKRLKLSGLIFGEIMVDNKKRSYDVDVDLSLKNGFYMEEPFDEMVVSGLFKDGILHVDDLSMTKQKSIGLHIDGIIPITRTGNHAAISMESTFSNISLKFIHRFIPEFFNIGGSASGSITLNGTSKKTHFSYDININKPEFELVKMQSLTSKGSYDGENLHIESAYAKNDNGFLSASGDVPFDLNIGSENFGKFFIDQPINLKSQADLSDLPFLSPYIADLDSAEGNYKINLNIEGLINNLKRDGDVVIQNGVLHTQLLNDPIRFINGRALLANNRLKIENLSARIARDNEKYKDEKIQNTHISGEVSLKRFFNPHYDLKLLSKNASFRLLFLDITGTTNLDLSISGRDTIYISGKIEPEDVNVFYEFATEDIGTAIVKDQGTTMSYDLNIPLRNRAFFQNSQIDAEITGELNLSQTGYQEVDFGGQIIVEDGSAFTHKDNFENLNGVVTFDNKGFNPLINLSAYTMIDNERIELRMIGGIDDPDILLESASGFSESDILELLTWGKRFEDQEGTSTGFGNQTVSFLGALLETQLEKNIKESNIGMISYFDDINISGAAGLLQGSNENFELAAKKQIGDKTFLNLSYKRSFSLNDQSQLGVEYKLNRHFSVVANVGKDGNYNLKYRYKYAY